MIVLRFLRNFRQRHFKEGIEAYKARMINNVGILTPSPSSTLFPSVSSEHL
jgi:hypothetical protein